MIRATQRLCRLARYSTPSTPAASKPAQVSAAPDFHIDPPGFRAPGVVATDYELAAGAERREYLARLQGRDHWTDMHPVVVDRLGTTKSPVHVSGYDVERYVGCTGLNDSHEPVYLTLRQHKHGVLDKCPNCGCTFQYTQKHHSEHH